MSKQTKELIKKEFIRQLENKTIDKITVKGITSALNINRNTFYYHFTDIPELIKVINDELIDQAIKNCPDVTNIDESLEYVKGIVNANKRIYLNAYSSRDINIMHEIAYKFSDNLAIKIVEKTEEMVSNVESRDNLIAFYRNLISGYIIDWFHSDLNTNTKTNKKEIIDSLQNLINLLSSS